MARIRTVKPDLWKSEQIGEVSVEARLTFLGLITQADDYGRMKGNAKLVRSLIFPYDDFPLRKVSEWLRELHEANLIRWYEVEGREYIELPTWGDHQRVSHPTDSALPSHSEADSAGAPQALQKLPEDVRREGKGREGNKEGIGKESFGVTPTDASRSEFDEWLADYHRVTGRTSVTGSKAARDAFKARCREGKTLQDLKFATRGCQSDPWRIEKGHNIPETILRASNVEGYISQAKDQPARAAPTSHANRFAEMARQAEIEERQVA